MILAIVLRNYSTKPSYIFQLKRELKVWKYIFNLFHFEILIQNRNPKFRPLCLFVFTFHEYEARFVFGFLLDYKLSLFIFSFCVKLFCVLFMCYNQYKLNKMNCELMLTYDTPALRQTGSRNLMGPKMLPTIWGTYMTLVTKYQISVINN